MTRASLLAALVVPLCLTSCSHHAKALPPGLATGISQLTTSLNAGKANAPVLGSPADAALPSDSKVTADPDHAVIVGDTAEVPVALIRPDGSKEKWVLMMVRTHGTWRGYGTRHP